MTDSGKIIDVCKKNIFVYITPEVDVSTMFYI